MQMLAVVDRDVCLQRQTTLWSLCADWLKQEVGKESDWSAESIRKKIEVSLEKFLETSLGKFCFIFYTPEGSYYVIPPVVRPSVCPSVC